MANSVPHVIAAGRAGGIVIVIKFRDLSMISTVPIVSSITGSVIKKPINATIPMMKTNFNESE